MPIYEYECLSCGHNFEQLVFKYDAQVSCPKCEQPKVHKKLSMFSSPGSKQATGSGTASCGSCTSKNCSSCG